MGDCTDDRCMYAVLTPFIVVIVMLLASVVVIAWPVDKEAMKVDCDQRQKEEEEEAAEELALRKARVTWDSAMKSGEGSPTDGSGFLVITAGEVEPNKWKNEADTDMVVDESNNTNAVRNSEPAFEMHTKPNEPKA